MADNDRMDNETTVGDEESEVAQVDSPEEHDARERTEEGEEPPVDEVERLREELEEARSEADEYLDGWRRAQAEFSNYKKRQRNEQSKVRELANASLLRKLLPVLDDFQRAIVTMPDVLEKLSWTHGLLMVGRKLEATLETEGVEPIETQGESFDPNYHEAVTHEGMPGYEEGQIIAEVQKGYTLGDRVLRPALVRVARAPRVLSEEEEDSQEGEE